LPRDKSFSQEEIIVERLKLSQEEIKVLQRRNKSFAER
jgi:hypothetical protein